VKFKKGGYPESPSYQYNLFFSDNRIKKLVLGIMTCRLKGKATLNVEPRTLNPEVFATNIWQLR